MELQVSESGEKSRLRALLDHFGKIEDPREPWRVAHPLPEVLLLVVWNGCHRDYVIAARPSCAAPYYQTNLCPRNRVRPRRRQGGASIWSRPSTGRLVYAIFTVGNLPADR